MTMHDAVRIQDALYRRDFASFVGKCFDTLVPGHPYLNNWHIGAMAHHCEEVQRGRIRHLITNVAPRSLKSLTHSVAFPAFVLGHDQTKPIIVVSYGADLAGKLSNDFRTIMSASWYRRIFPGTRISRWKNTESEVVTTRGGHRLATSIDGTLTGRGGDIIIVDDPLKPIDALSDSKRERVNEWANHTLFSRLDDKRTGAIVVVMQRLHTHDLTGMLLEGSKDWTLLSLPAIAVEEAMIPIGADRFYRRQVDEVLHPAREPREVLESMRAQIGGDNFEAQYQQKPVPPGGAMIKTIWVNRFDEPPPAQPPARTIQSWDTASKEGGEHDWSVCTTWRICDHRYYLIDTLRGRFDYPTLKARAIAHAGLHRPERILIEDAGVGTALIAELQRAGLSAIGIKPEHNKVTRMSIESAKFESGQVFFPRSAPWLHDVEAELFAFPNSPHDDFVDSISQALSHGMPGYGWNEQSLRGLGSFANQLALQQWLYR